MDPLYFIKARRSIRKYKSDPVPRNIILTILDAARLAPSARNNQPWKFIVITSAQTKRELAEASIYKFIADAPLVIAACALPKESLLGPVVDVIIALDHMSLVAANMGVANCWVGGVDHSEAARILKIPEEVKFVSLMTFGYASEKASSLKRKPLADIFSDESYQD